MRLGERRLAATASAMAATSLMKEFEILDHGEIGPDVVRVVAEILVQGNEIDLIEAAFEHVVLPVAEGRHAAVG